MCAAYNPPTEDIPTFNTLLFNQPEETLSQAEADKLYLSKIKNDTSTATLTTFNEQAEIKNNLTIGIRGVPQGIVSIYRKIKYFDIDNNQQTYGDLFGQGNDMKYFCKNDFATPATTHQFYTRATGSAIDNLQMTIANGTTTFTQQLILNSTLTSYFRFNHASTTYAFPFSGPTIQGYYLKTTGTGTAVTSATPTTILTTSSIGIGVWRIDFSVQNVVGATGAGTITQAQSYISTTLNGAVATAVPFTGSILRTHVSEVYGNNDVQIITGNITYNQSTAGVLYLNIVRTFAIGTYSFTGEVGLTRIA